MVHQEQITFDSTGHRHMVDLTDQVAANHHDELTPCRPTGNEESAARSGNMNNATRAWRNMSWGQLSACSVPSDRVFRGRVLISAERAVYQG